MDSWLKDLVGADIVEQDQWSERLECYVKECFCLTRTDEIFDIVADYPTSHVAVLKLCKVLHQTKMHS